MTVSTETLRAAFIKAAVNSSGSTHPEAPEGGQDSTPSMVSEGSFITEGQIYDSKIRSQKLQQKKHELRGNIAKTERKKLWADTEEVKRDIQADDLVASKKRRELNREGHTQSLAAKSYTVEQTRSRNAGRRQALVNEGISLKVDHTGTFEAATGQKEAK